jgi:hypothetical protein
MENVRKFGIDKTVSLISLWAALLLIGYSFLGVKWFETGDMGWREVMYYHGILISAWMLLLLACLKYLPINSVLSKWQPLVCLACLAAAVLSGIGGSLIHAEGLSFGRILQVLGMVFADLAAITTIILLAYSGKTLGSNEANKLALWTVVIVLAAISLATPLGHLAGAIKDVGDKIPALGTHAKLIGAEQDKAVEGYIGSHSHQIVAAFVVGACILPLVSIRSTARRWANNLMVLGIGVILAATIGQAALYQYSAWFGWEPPTLFESGPNGMPLDDLLLSIVAIGPLLAIPAVWIYRNGEAFERKFSLSRNKLVYLAFLSYVATMIGLGLYIEFHEGFFGGGDPESGASGVANDLSYIRAHLLYGCMVVPLLLGILLNLRKSSGLIVALTLAVIIAGISGVFFWTFSLRPGLAKLTLGLLALLLITGAAECWRQRKISNTQEMRT